MAELREKLRMALHVRRRFLQRLVWLLVIGYIVWVLIGTVGDQILLPIAQRQISELTGAKVGIGSVDLTNYGVVRMNQLTISAETTLPGRPISDELLLEAQQLEGRFSLTSLLLFHPRLREIRLKEFVANVEYDMDRDEWNLSRLDLARPDLPGPVPHLVAERGILKLRMVQKGRVRPLAVLGITGSFIPVKGKSNAFSYYIGVDSRLGYGGSELRGILKTGKQTELTCNGRILMGASPIFENTWDIQDIDASLELKHGDVAIRRLSCRVGQHCQLAILGSIHHFPRSPELKVGVKLTDWSLGLEPHPNTLVYSLPIREWLGYPLRQFLEHYQPRGRGDIDIDCSGPLLEPGRITLHGIIRCRDISILYEKFPYRLDGMNGVIEVTQNSAIFESLAARHGPVSLNVSGMVVGQGARGSHDVRITSSEMRLDADLYKALNDQQKALWFAFSPSGPAKIDYQYSKKGFDPPQTRLDVELTGTEAIYQHFPYPLRKLTGRVLIEKNQFTLEKVVSKYEGKTIELNGQITEIDTERPRFQMVIDANDIPIDSTLKEALTEKQREFYDNFEVDALTDVRVKIFPNEAGRRTVEYIASATIRGATLIFEKFPLPLTEVYAEAELTPDVVVIRQMTGRNGSADVRLSGQVWPPNESRNQMGYCLSLSAERLQVRQPWLKALPPKAVEIIEQLRPDGQVNLSAQISASVPQGSCTENRIQIQCLGNEVHYSQFPYPVRNLTGSITISPHRVEVQDLRAENMTLTQDSLAKMDGPLRSLLESIRPNGTIDIAIPKAVYVRDETGQGRLDFSAVMDFRQCSFGQGDFLTRCTGSLKLDGAYQPGAGPLDTNGTVHVNTLAVRGRDLNRLQGTFMYDSARKVFLSRDFSAECHDGKILGNLELGTDIHAGPGYRLELMFDSIEAAEILAKQLVGGQAAHGTNRGKASGVFTLSGQLGRNESSLGRLHMEIRDLQLAKRTLTGKVLSAVKLHETTDYLFDQIFVDAWIRGNQMVFDEVYMAGARSLLKGQGNLDLRSGQVHLDFTVSPGKGTKDPSFLESLALALGSTLVKVEVRGPMDNPTIHSSGSQETGSAGLKLNPR